MKTTKKQLPLKITEHNKNNKMEGFQSLNTSVENNSFCNKMKKKDSICKRCYALGMERRYKALGIRLKRNSEILSSSIILEKDIIDTFNTQCFRFSSFGELINEVHFINLLNICKKNKKTLFTLWTKRKSLVQKVLQNINKPTNLILIYSSPTINVVSPLPLLFDKVFTCYDKDYLNNNVVNINCLKSCKNCMKCYSKNNTKLINEVVR